MDNGSPTIRRRRLAQHLKALRDAKGLGVNEAGRALGWGDGSRVTRLEAAFYKKPRWLHIEELLELYGADAATTAELKQLVKDAGRRGWWEDRGFRGIFNSALVEFEIEASSFRVFETTFPGLLHTPEYAAAAFRGGLVLDDTQVQRRVEGRLRRQEIFKRQCPPHYWLILDEAALHRMVGGREVMIGQIQHVIDMAADENLTVQILPFEVGAHQAGDGPFTILQFPDPQDPEVVYVETLIANIFMEKPEELATYKLAFNHLRAKALPADESLERLLARVDQLAKLGDHELYSP